jgi:uncharacterized protein (DUF2147 family)
MSAVSVIPGLTRVISALAPTPVIPGLARDPSQRAGSAPSGSHGLRVKSAMTSVSVIPGLTREPCMSVILGALTGLTLLLASSSASAQMSPVGVWHSIDDKTGEAKAEIRIVDTGGVLSGRIERLLRKDAPPDEKCVKCRDERKDKPMVGLEIIRGATKTPGKDEWEGGNILDPENGREYTLRLTPTGNGQKLDVRGSFGPFGRTQTWVRVR